MWLALHSVKSVNVDFRDEQIRIRIHLNPKFNNEKPYGSKIEIIYVFMYVYMYIRIN